MSIAERISAPERAVSAVASVAQPATAIGILFAASASHMLNDMMQSLAPALYPVFRSQYSLTFFQTGIITLVFQVTASLLQPIIGLVTDRRPAPRALPFAMGFTLLGLVLLAFSGSYAMLLVSVAFIGVGSAVFHPEASRAARAASGGRYGFAQSLFQVGGNFGQSLGPLMAAFIVVPGGQISVLAFTALAFIAILLLMRVAQWQVAHASLVRKSVAHPGGARIPRNVVWRSIGILVVLLFSKTFYLASINTFYTFYLMNTFDLPVQTAQVLLFVFLGAVAVGTFAGGPIGDRIGRKYVIWVSILGVLPFTLLLPHLGLIGTVIDFDRDRPDPLVGFLGDGRLCAGACAGERRRDRRPVLRPVVRARRPRRRGARVGRRPHEPDLRLPDLRLSAGDRTADVFPAGHAREESVNAAA